MGILIDVHVHTQRHSPCSVIAPDRLIGQAVKAGLDGLVITEHHYQWAEDELAELTEKADAPGFLLMAGMEYASTKGDILMYGLTRQEANELAPGLTPREAITIARGFGAVCIAAHPTREGLGFDEEILSLPLDAIEVQSVNLRPHEQRMAMILAVQTGIPPIAASDAHHLHNVGRYAAEFIDPIRSMADLREAMRRGRFRVGGCKIARTGSP